MIRGGTKPRSQLAMLLPENYCRTADRFRKKITSLFQRQGQCCDRRLGPVLRGAGFSSADEPKIKHGDLELTEKEWRGLQERHALEESRRLSLPATPEAYELKLPSEFVQPPGVEFKFDERNPVIGLARKFAHEAGLSQPQFEKMASIYAAEEVAKASMLRTAKEAELGKLGATATQRVTAITTFLRGHLGEELGQKMSTMLVTAKHVEGFEKLMQKFTVGGTGTFSHAHRDTNERPAMSDERWASMSYGERKDYADRATFANNGGRR